MQKGSNTSIVEKPGWTGTIGEIKLMFSSQTKSIKTVLHNENEQINDALPGLRTKVRDNTRVLAELQESVAAMDQTLGKILQALRKEKANEDDASFGFP